MTVNHSELCDKEVGRSDMIQKILADFDSSETVFENSDRAVAVFGSARLSSESPYYQVARELGRNLAQHDISVVTGGGPGIMEAANRGAHEANGTSIGLGIEIPYEVTLNDYVDRGMTFHYFFTRKVMCTKNVTGFAVFPGGFGTLDEMFEILTLEQNRKLPNYPIVLVGVSYWAGLIEWLRGSMLSEGLISPDCLKLLRIVDTADDAVKVFTP